MWELMMLGDEMIQQPTWTDPTRFQPCEAGLIQMDKKNLPH